MERVGEGSRVRDMYARGYTSHIWWKKESRWRDSHTDVPVCLDLHTYSQPSILVHKKITYTKLSHPN